MILQNMCLFLFNHVNKIGTFFVPAHFFAPVFISVSWYDKAQTATDLCEWRLKTGEKHCLNPYPANVENNASRWQMGFNSAFKGIRAYGDKLLDTVQRDTNKWPVGVHKVLKNLGSTSKL